MFGKFVRTLAMLVVVMMGASFIVAPAVSAAPAVVVKKLPQTSSQAKKHVQCFKLRWTGRGKINLAYVQAELAATDRLYLDFLDAWWVGKPLGFFDVQRNFFAATGSRKFKQKKLCAKLEFFHVEDLEEGRKFWLQWTFETGSLNDPDRVFTGRTSVSPSVSSGTPPLSFSLEERVLFCLFSCYHKLVQIVKIQK